MFYDFREQQAVCIVLPHIDHIANTIVRLQHLLYGDMAVMVDGYYTHWLVKSNS